MAEESLDQEDVDVESVVNECVHRITRLASGTHDQDCKNILLLATFCLSAHKYWKNPEAFRREVVQPNGNTDETVEHLHDWFKNRARVLWSHFLDLSHPTPMRHKANLRRIIRRTFEEVGQAPRQSLPPDAIGQALQFLRFVGLDVSNVSNVETLVEALRRNDKCRVGQEGKKLLKDIGVGGKWSDVAEADGARRRKNSARR